MRHKNEPVIPPRPPLMCSTAGCPYDGRVRSGKLVLCHSCRDEQIRRANLDWCKAHGLNTVEKQKAFCRSVLRQGIVKRMQLTQREPGKDREEIFEQLPPSVEELIET